MIVACYHPLPLSACMLNFDLVSILSGTSIPTSFNILVKMFLHLFHWFLLCVATCINLLAFVLPPLHTYEDSQQLAVTPTSCLVRILHTEYNHRYYTFRKYSIYGTTAGPVMATVSRSKKRTQGATLVAKQRDKPQPRPNF